jgi:hypothetical protein
MTSILSSQILRKLVTLKASKVNVEKISIETTMMAMVMRFKNKFPLMF